jgi:hypothetical protein
MATRVRYIFDAKGPFLKPQHRPGGGRTAHYLEVFLDQSLGRRIIDAHSVEHVVCQRPMQMIPPKELP